MIFSQAMAGVFWRWAVRIYTGILWRLNHRS